MSLDGDGYAQPGLRDKSLDGTPIFCVPGGFSLEGQGGGPNLLPNAAGGHNEQWLWQGGTGPLGKRPMTGELNFQDVTEAQLRAARRAPSRIVRFWPEWPIEDTFFAAEGHTAFSLSRPHGYASVAGVTPESHPFVIELNGVEQTVIYGENPEPDAGEVGVITTAGAQWRAIITPPLSAADELVVSFYPLLRIRTTFSGQHRSQGDISYSLSWEESLAGRWD